MSEEAFARKLSNCTSVISEGDSTVIADFEGIKNVLQALDDSFQFPLKIGEDCMARLMFVEKMAEFLHYLESNSVVDASELQIIKWTGSKLNEIWLDYNKGRIQTALSKLHFTLYRKINESKTLVDMLKVTIHNAGDSDIDSSPMSLFNYECMQHVFRSRVRDQAEFTPPDMLHIPFNRRDNVGIQRYSISGFPCLYLAGSVYCCWLEMDRPNLDQFNVVRLQLIDPLSFIDLSLVPRQVQYLMNMITNRSDWGDAAAKMSMIRELFQRCIFSFPLLLACSILNTNHTNNFRSDYIIPQLLTLSIANDKDNISGIKYISNKVINRATPIMEYSLMIIPVQKRDSDVLSEYVCKHFAVTQSINARLLLDLLSIDNCYMHNYWIRAFNQKMYLPVLAKDTMYDGIRPNILGDQMTLLNGRSLEYRNTPCGKIEMFLMNCGAEVIKKYQ